MSLQPDGTAAREGVRIRHYIVSLRYRNPGKAFRIPTSVELAKMFGVARSTVTLELKALTEDGIIIGKRGVGTFTNPAIEYIFPETEHASPLIGLLCGDGQRFFYEHYAWSMLARTGLELTQRQCNVSYVSGPFNAGEISESFLQTGLSGGVWISPPEWAAEPCERLAEAGIPVVTGEQELPGIPGAGYDFEETGCRIGRMLLDEGCRSIAILLSHEVTDLVKDGIVRAYREAGAEPEFRLYYRFPEQPGLEQFGRDVAAGDVPDAVYAHGYSSVRAWKTLNDNRIPPGRCRLIVNRHSLPGPDFRGILFTHPEEAHAEALAGQLISRLRGEEPQPRFCRIPCDVCRIRTPEDAPVFLPPP